jgi:predicted 3-demethylubiquinone-9 3-methyltransferase (glyoxalase superfamily)
MAEMVRPFLMFTGDAEAAMNLYVSLFPDGDVLELRRHPPGSPGPEGKVMRARFRVGDQEVICSDSAPVHDFTFTPSTSLFVDCETEARLDELFARLSEGGEVLMPPGGYGFSRKFAWVNDRFGVSWQLNLA